MAELSQALAPVGIDVAVFKGDSFQIRAATSAACQILGRWKSSAFLSYIRTPREVLSAASVALADQ